MFQYFSKISILATITRFTAITATPLVGEILDLPSIQKKLGTTSQATHSGLTIEIKGLQTCDKSNTLSSIMINDFKYYVTSDNKPVCDKNMVNVLNQMYHNGSIITTTGENIHQTNDIVKRWNPVIIGYNVVMIGGSTASATITLGTLIAALGGIVVCVALATGFWWGWNYLTNNSGNSKKVNVRSLKTRYKCNQGESCGGGCQNCPVGSKSCNLGYSFADYDTNGIKAQQDRFDVDSNLEQSCLQQAINAGYSSVICSAWIQDAEGTYETFNLNYQVNC